MSAINNVFDGHGRLEHRQNRVVDAIFDDTILAAADMNRSTIQGAYRQWRASGWLRYMNTSETQPARSHEQTAREYLIECGFGAEQVTEFLTAQAALDVEMRREAAKRQAYEQTRRFRVRRWFRVRRRRSVIALDVLRGTHRCCSCDDCGDF